MPSSQDFFDRLGEINGKLTDVNNKLQSVMNNTDGLEAGVQDVKNAVQQVTTTLSSGFGQLITLGTYTNEALFHNAQQNDTIICILERISHNTCEIWNEAHAQTGLQRAMAEHTRKLADLYAATHADAELERQKLETLRRQIEECCPPPKPTPPCRYEPCEAPKRLAEPPKPGTQPRPPR